MTVTVDTDLHVFRLLFFSLVILYYRGRYDSSSVSG